MDEHGSPKADGSSGHSPSPIEINQNFFQGGQEEHEALTPTSARRKNYREFLQTNG